MLIESKKTPPFILRLVNTPFSAIEALLPFNTQNTAPVSQPNLPLQTDETFDQYILAQILMYYYIKIFVFPETTILYKNVLDSGLAYIRSQTMKIKDSNLRQFIYEYIDELDQSNTSEAIRLLEVSILRIQPEKVYPTINSISSIILAIYGRRKLPTNSTVIVHRVSFQNIDGWSDPTFILSPCFETSLDTTNYEELPVLFWKFIFSLNLQNKITMPDETTSYLNLLALLALPLDPMALTIEMRKNLSSNAKTGIPFINYLAMYLRERTMGLNYDLSPFADARRILMKRAHQFCGVGGTSISDYYYAKYFLESFMEQNKDENETQRKELLSQEDLEILTGLLNGRPDAVLKFTKKLNHGQDALEAKKSSTSSDDGAFSDDTDMTDDSSEDPQSSDKNDDDNMDRTSDISPESAAANKKAFIPLALPTETIDDHLLRLMVLNYTRDADLNPSPDITPENLETLKYWCGLWLFVASIDQTKKLLSQLNITGKLKELSL